MSVIINKYLNSNKEEILAKKYNIFIGISLGNKRFTPVLLQEYIQWSLEYTKKYVAILIADEIQAINLEVSSGYSTQRALSVSLRKGLETRKVVEKIIAGLPPEKTKKIKILHWCDINDSKYQKKVDALVTNFESNIKFHDRVMKTVLENISKNNKNLSQEKCEKLATYPLSELPLLAHGLDYQGVHYSILPYPGLGLIDELAIDLQKGNKFFNISRLLKKRKTIILEAYVR